MISKFEGRLAGEEVITNFTLSLAQREYYYFLTYTIMRSSNMMISLGIDIKAYFIKYACYYKKASSYYVCNFSSDRNVF